MALDKFQPYLFVSAGEQSNKYLTPVISPNGIARFQAQRAQSLAGLKVRIDPIQEGSGDPSPTNIRPISGRTGMTVTRAGKNLLDLSEHLRASSNGLTFTPDASDGNKVAISGTASSTWSSMLASQIPIALKAGRTYTFSVGRTIPNSAFIRIVNADGTNTARVIPANSDHITWTQTADGTTVSEIVLQNLTSGSAVNYTLSFMVEDGASATDYTPYVGQTYPITWETEAGTVYGGTLDVASGVLTVDRAIVDMGTLNYTYDSSGGRFYTSVSGKKNESSDSEMMLAISSMYKPMTATAFQSNPTNGTMRGATVGGYCYFRNNEYTDAAAFKTAMAGQTLVYELATPQTYQLTPTEVRTIAGLNQIYSDAGPVIDIKF